MQAAIINGHNRIFTAPDGHDKVRTLFGRAEAIDGIPLVTTAWDAEQREVGLLLAGAKFHLGLSVPVYPVVNLSIADLPTHFEPVFTARKYDHPKLGTVCRVECLVASPPHGLRMWAERPIVAGFSAAFQSAVEGIEETARQHGIEL